MNMNELMTVPDDLKATPESRHEVSTQSAIDVPENMKTTVVSPEAVVAVDVIDQVPSNIEVYQIPRTLMLGEMALQKTINVPSAAGAVVVEPGTPLNGPREKVVIGSLDEYKGGNPHGVIGYDGNDDGIK